ncbi:MAG: XdhC family protein [Anaerolineae bacterium]|jgi:xanthine dehydrogenase accessory factor
MRAILEDVARWLAAGESIALATVVGTEGSSPRLLGSRMAITESGQMTGSVSGGCAEGDVFRRAQTVLGGQAPRRVRYTGVDEEGWGVGLACGGTIEVFIERLGEVHRQLVDSLEHEETVALATRLDGSGHLIAWPDGRLYGDRTLASQLVPLLPHPTAEHRRHPQGDVFLEVFAPWPTLTVVGAVHIAIPLVVMARELGYRVRVVDARRAFATRDRFGGADELLIAWPAEAMDSEHLRSQDAVVVLAHDPKFDVPALERALRSPVGYIGLLGSTTTQQKRQAALKGKGFSDKDLARIHGPVGLDLGGRRPPEIALAILAEMVAVKHGRRPDGPNALPARRRENGDERNVSSDSGSA